MLNTRKILAANLVFYECYQNANESLNCAHTCRFSVVQASHYHQGKSPG